MSSLTTVEKRYFEDLFNMGTGYVLDFTNDSFAQFFGDTVRINIYHGKYDFYGDSKAKRLRAFWKIESDIVVGKVLSEMLAVWKFEHDKRDDAAAYPGYIECKKIVNRLLGKSQKEIDSESGFLTQDFGEIKISSLKIDPSIIPIVEYRIKEAKICLENNLSLSVIFLCGSVLEGILLAIATQHTKEFNQCKTSPKDKQGKIKPLYEWSLANFIDTSCEMDLLGLDVKKICHVLRDFRNYIHPYQQLASNFNPDRNTAQICMKVLEAAIADINEKKW